MQISLKFIGFSLLFYINKKSTSLRALPDKINVLRAQKKNE